MGTRQHSESWMMVPPPPEEIKEVAEVQLVWLSDLSMEIQLDENKTDVILLAPTSNIPGEETPCLFSGKVGKDLDSLVSIASRRLPGGFADLTISEGTTYEVSFEGLFFEGSRCTCADGEISCAVELPRVDPPAPPQVPTDPLMDSAPRLPSAQSAPRLPSAQASAPRLPSAPKVTSQQRRLSRGRRISSQLQGQHLPC